MPPRRIKKDPKDDWIPNEEGTLVNPNSEEGLRLRGLRKPGLPVVPYTEEVVPANAAARLKATPHGDLRLYKGLPKDCEVTTMAVADDAFPDAKPLPAIVCDTDDVPKVLESLFGDQEPPRYKTKTGLEFEWTTPPVGFHDDAKPALIPASSSE